MAEQEDKKDSKDKKEEKDPKGEEAAPPKKSKLLFIILGVTIVGGCGGGFLGYKMFFKKPAEDSKDAPVDDHGDKKDAPDDKKDASAEKKDEKKDASAEKKDEKKDAPAEKKDEKKDDKGEKKDDHGSKSESEDPKKDGKTKNDPNAFGDTFVISKMDINLDNPLENRYVHLSLTLEYAGGKSQEEDLKKREPQIRDVIITAASTRTRAELLSPYGKQRLRQEIFNKLNEVLDKPIKKVYFTDFLVE